LINRSTLRNDIVIFDFIPGLSADFGLRGAEICDVEITDKAGTKLVQVLGGEQVVIRVCIFLHQDVDYPIIGFSFKDKLGQVLFGDNTYLSHRNSNILAKAGINIVASFSFQMPILPAGDYSIAAAVASGTQDEHVQHHWIHDAIILKSISSSVSTGLIGLPMSDISISIGDNDIRGSIF